MEQQKGKKITIKENTGIVDFIKIIEDNIGVTLSAKRKELYTKSAEAIKFLRRNPAIACEKLLHIELLDCQKWILQMVWNAEYSNLTCSRNYGKSFLLSVIAALNILLYPDQEIFIVSSVGAQAINTFEKIEKIALGGITSIKNPSDLFKNEVIANNNSNGFVHDKSGFYTKCFNGSRIQTLNSNPDNNRGYRATLLLLDESNFCSDELIDVVLPFLSQDSNFELGTDGIDDEDRKEVNDTRANRKKLPNRVIYSSSAGSVDSAHYRSYREFGREMLMGNLSYFVADIPCTLPLSPMLNGRPFSPLLKQSDVDNAMKTNPEKARREYYNKFELDGGSNQLIKRSTIIRNETFYKPQMFNADGTEKFVLAFDPARINDNSIFAAMKIIHDENIGYYGEISSCTNLIDIGKKRKVQMKTPDQLNFIKQSILDYNGQTADYENIERILIDGGAGGGGISAYTDNLLKDWHDSQGIKHRGLIDASYKLYEEEARNFPNAIDKVTIIDPKKMKEQMIGELVSLMSLDLIKFPKSYDGRPSIPIPIVNEEGMVEGTKDTHLTLEEQISLINIDLMKEEMIIWRTVTNNGVTKYTICDEKKSMNDDRFDVLLFLAHYLYELRRGDQLKGGRRAKRNLRDYFASN